MKILIYTANIGGYDKVQNTPFQADNIVYKEVKELNEDLSNVKKARLIKICPHRFFPVEEFDCVVWHDSNMNIIGDPTELCKTIKNMAFMKHRFNSERGVRKEANDCIALKREKKEILDHQLQQYENEGLLPEFVYETGFNIRTFKDNNMSEIMEKWWEQVSQYSYRDQISLPYIIKKYNVEHDVMPNLDGLGKIVKFKRGGVH